MVKDGRRYRRGTRWGKGMDWLWLLVVLWDVGVYLIDGLPYPRCAAVSLRRSVGRMARYTGRQSGRVKPACCACAPTDSMREDNQNPSVIQVTTRGREQITVILGTVGCWVEKLIAAA